MDVYLGTIPQIVSCRRKFRGIITAVPGIIACIKIKNKESEANRVSTIVEQASLAILLGPAMGTDSTVDYRNYMIKALLAVWNGSDRKGILVL